MRHVVLAVALAATVGATWLYRAFAARRGIVARTNARTLHHEVVPRGGGVVFGSVFSLCVVLLWAVGELPLTLMLALGAGGAAAVTVGFMDDVHEITAPKKLGIHACLSGWLLAILYGPVYATVLGDLPLLSRIVATAAAVLVPLWLINLYNFIDGIDGMAIGGSVFVCGAALAALAIGGSDRNEESALAFALLAACSVGFLFFNLPPASVFMGDAGSIFLGYTFAALLLTTVFTGQLALFTWITMLGYFIGDTTTTTLCRIFMVKRWYGVHRSHAYQNLARVLRSHAKVTYGVALYHVCWVLPLVVWCSRNPARGHIAAALSVMPSVFWTLRFGPRYSSD